MDFSAKLLKKLCHFLATKVPHLQIRMFHKVLMNVSKKYTISLNYVKPICTCLFLKVVSVCDIKLKQIMEMKFLYLYARTSEEMDGTLPRIASFENT